MFVTNEIQNYFDKANRIVFMTGAGVSTASGIPDYRSKNGLYTNNQQLKPEFLLSATALKNIPEFQYKFMKDNMYFPNAKPNIIHQKMAEFSNIGKAITITQNVDNLHLMLDPTVIEFHGNLYRIYEAESRKPASWQEYLISQYKNGKLLRPDITLYEEIPQHINDAQSAVTQADLIVIVGTSFQVYPFAGLLSYASSNAKVISINLEKILTSFHVQQIIVDAKDFFAELQVTK
ncbi:MAG: NAD-dependent protein deacylase [Lactobacillaceae bacterium]|nr:NAD-dependent protein deacylase [Lactobacillaceae bacterium]